MLFAQGRKSSHVASAVAAAKDDVWMLGMVAKKPLLRLKGRGRGGSWSERLSRHAATPAPERQIACPCQQGGGHNPRRFRGW